MIETLINRAPSNTHQGSPSIPVQRRGTGDVGGNRPTVGSISSHPKMPPAPEEIASLGELWGRSFPRSGGVGLALEQFPNPALVEPLGSEQLAAHRQLLFEVAISHRRLEAPSREILETARVVAHLVGRNLAKARVLEAKEYYVAQDMLPRLAKS